MNICVQRANVLLTVPEEQKDEYLAKGFDVIDEKTGKVLEATIPSDAGALKVKVEQLQKKVKELEEENSSLKVQIKSLNEELDSLAEEVPSTQEGLVDPPKKTSSKKSSKK